MVVREFPERQKKSSDKKRESNRAKAIFEQAKESDASGYEYMLKLQEEMVEMILLAEDKRDWESSAITAALDRVTEEYIESFKEFILDEYSYQRAVKVAEDCYIDPEDEDVYK